MKAKKNVLLTALMGFCVICAAQKFTKPEATGPLRNDPALEQEFIPMELNGA